MIKITYLRDGATLSIKSHKDNIDEHMKNFGISIVDVLTVEYIVCTDANDTTVNE